MSSEYGLDPVAGIPDAPDDESKVLDWAKELTQSLQRDHIANVNRTETAIMSENGLNKRPDETGSRRFFFDEDTGTLYLDSENPQGVAAWININNPAEYVSDGIGVHVIYSTALPYNAGTSGTFSFDEEVYDKDDYWDVGDPTEINPPEAKTYQIVFVATIDNLADTENLLIAIDIDGVSTEMNVGEFAQTVSTGAGEEYELKISCLKEMNDVNTLTFVWISGASFDMSECYAIVTPMTLSGGGGAVPDDTGITDHGLLSGLLDVGDHTAAVISAATGSFDGILSGADATVQAALDTIDDHVHSGTICLDKNLAYQIKDSGDTCRNMVAFVSQVQYFGYDALPVNVDGSTIHIDSGGTLSLTGEAITISSENNEEILIDSTGYLTFESSSGIRIKSWNEALKGRIEGSATYYDMIKVGASNRMTIGNTTLNTYFESGTIFVGIDEATLYFADSGSNERAIGGYNGTTFEWGSAATITKIVGKISTSGQCGMTCFGYSSVAAVPSSTHFPANTWGIHRDTNANETYLVFNRGSTIEKVQLT